MKLVRFLPYLLLLLLPLVIGTAVAEPNEPTAVESLALWESARQLTANNGNTPFGAQRPVIAAAPNGDLMVVYMKQLSADELDTDPYYRKSTDDGDSWTTPLPIYTSAASSRQVHVAFDNLNRAHAVWTEDDDQLWYARDSAWASNGAKQLFTTAEILIESPKLAVDATGTVHLVWFQADFISQDLYYSRSTNGGTFWSAPENISNSLGSSQSPALAIDGNGRVNVVWEEQVGGTDYQINFSRRAANGSWTAPIGISTVVNTVTSAREPDINIVGNRVMVVFEDRAALNQQTLYYLECSSGCNVSPPTSATWQSRPATAQTFTAKDTDPTFLSPKIITAGGCRVVFFSGIIGNPSTSNEKIFTGDSCSGFSANPAIKAVENSLGANDRAIKPYVAAVDNWTVYVAYERKGLTRSDIYYVKNIPAIFLPLIEK